MMVSSALTNESVVISIASFQIDYIIYGIWECGEEGNVRSEEREVMLEPEKIFDDRSPD